MRITVHDTISELEPFFIDTTHPKARFERAERTILAPDGLVRELQGMEKNGFAVMEAAQHDGYSVAVGQQVWGLFNPTRKQEASIWVFEQLREQKVPESIEIWLRQLGAHFNEAILPAEMTCYVLPGDPANRSLMINSHGLSCLSGGTDKVLVQIWPSSLSERRE